MPPDIETYEAVPYRLLILAPDSRGVLIQKSLDGRSLPTIAIPRWIRPAQQLQRAIADTWSLPVIILDILPASEGYPACAVAESLVSPVRSDLRAVSISELNDSELADRQRDQVDTLLAAPATDGPLGRIGWIEEAIRWLESETHAVLSSRADIEQFNAGGRFSLLRFLTQDGKNYWLKATGDPNAHELSVTAFLSTVCGRYLPEIIATRPAWSAWLMSGEAKSLDEFPADPFRISALLGDAAASMAKLQILTLGRGRDLLAAGAFNQGLDVFQREAEALFDFLSEAMSLQTSTKVPRIPQPRLEELRSILISTCGRMEDLGLPEMVVHGDLNQGNILIGSDHCKFIDWPETYVGNPLVALQRLLLLGKTNDPKLGNFITSAVKDRYKSVLSDTCDPAAVEKGFVYMPLLAIASSLYGRGDWLDSPRRYNTHWQAYARSLARHMDRAALEPQLEEKLCV